ncbi:MAG: hypothetical protein ACTTG8_09965 [Catonella sp.]
MGKKYYSKPVVLEGLKKWADAYEEDLNNGQYDEIYSARAREKTL